MYETCYKVSRGVFSTTDSDLKPWVSPKPTPRDTNSYVYSRLFEDFNRRQEARNRLKAIMELKQQSDRNSLNPNSTVNPTTFLYNNHKKKFTRSLNKAEIDQMVQRLQKFWENKWMKIENKKKELALAQEQEIQKFNVKSTAKNDPEVFKRLITPRTLVSTPSKPEIKKFSIREAIESGKRLMSVKPQKSLSPVYYSGSNRQIIKEILEKSHKYSPVSKTSRNTKRVKDINDIISMSKSKAVIQQRLKLSQPNFEISKTLNISLIPSTTNLNL